MNNVYFQSGLLHSLSANIISYLNNYRTRGEWNSIKEWNVTNRKFKNIFRHETCYLINDYILFS